MTDRIPRFGTSENPYQLLDKKPKPRFEQPSNEEKLEDRNGIVYISIIGCLIIFGIFFAVIFGSNVSASANLCETSPCVNGGKCTPDGASYKCSCTSFFTGPTCSEDVNECSTANFCQNGGTCTNKICGLDCACVGNYIGDRCGQTASSALRQELGLTGLTLDDFNNNPSVQQGVKDGIATSLSVPSNNVKIESVSAGSRRRLLQAGIKVVYDLELTASDDKADLENRMKELKTTSKTTLVTNVKEKIQLRVEEEISTNPSTALNAILNKIKDIDLTVKDPVDVCSKGRGFVNGVCTECPDNTYNDENSNLLNSVCKPQATCGLGQSVRFTPTKVNINLCVDCPENTYSDTDDFSTSCKPLTKCGPGQEYNRYVTVEGLNDLSMTTAECQAYAVNNNKQFTSLSNPLSPGGCFLHTGNTPNDVYYNLDLTMKCNNIQKCIQKTNYTNLPKDRNSECVDCPAGEYSDVNDYSKCKPFDLCDMGTRLISEGDRTKNIVCTPCSSSQFAVESGGHYKISEAMLQYVNPTTTPLCNYRTTPDPNWEANHLGCSAIPSVEYCNLICRMNNKIYSSYQIEKVGSTYYKTCRCSNEFLETNTSVVNYGSGTGIFTANGIYGQLNTCKDHRVCQAGEYIVSYGNLVNDTVCQTCPEGKYTLLSNQNQCLDFSDCDPGFFISVEGTASSNRECSQCPPNTFTNIKNQVACQGVGNCLPGTYVSSTFTYGKDRTCTPCPVSTYSTQNNSASCTTRSYCDIGKEVDVPYTSKSDDICKDCDDGFFSNTFWSTPCQPRSYCPPGKEVVQVGDITKDDVCKDCDDNFYSNKTDLSPCYPRSFCGPGQEASPIGSKLQDDICKPCDNGFYSEKLDTSPCIARSGCPIGTYVVREGDVEQDDYCRPCDGGFYTDEMNLPACKERSYCGPGEEVEIIGNTERDDECRNCTEGKYSTTRDTNPCIDRSYCPPGQEPTEIGNTKKDDVCKDCDAGKYSDATDLNMCQERSFCGIGKQPKIVGSDSSNDVCEDCPNGKFSSTVGVSYCNYRSACPPGEQVVKIGNITMDDICEPCPENTFKKTTDLSSCQARSYCSPGFYIKTLYTPQTNDVCQICPASTYSNTSTASSCTPFTVCLDGIETAGSNTKDVTCRVCCQALTATCQSCKLNQNIQTYCLNNPSVSGCSYCQNVDCGNGQCNDLANDYTCVCDAGWEGRHCDTNIDECATNPCVNGNCTDSVADFICTCEAGWEGKSCDQNINECATNPCVNGECTDLIADYNCVCQPGWEGKNCDQNIDDCALNARSLLQVETYGCSNSAQEFSDMTLDQCKEKCVQENCQLISTNVDLQFEDSQGTCKIYTTCVQSVLESGYSSFSIQKASPCVNGQCTDKINNYTCTCEPGWEGRNCDINIDECATNPCVNGECVDQINNYTCVCQPGFDSDVNCLLLLTA